MAFSHCSGSGSTRCIPPPAPSPPHTESVAGSHSPHRPHPITLDKEVIQLSLDITDLKNRMDMCCRAIDRSCSSAEHHEHTGNLTILQRTLNKRMRQMQALMNGEVLPDLTARRARRRVREERARQKQERKWEMEIAMAEQRGAREERHRQEERLQHPGGHIYQRMPPYDMNPNGMPFNRMVPNGMSPYGMPQGPPNGMSSYEMPANSGQYYGMPPQSGLLFNGMVPNYNLNCGMPTQRPHPHGRPPSPYTIRDEMRTLRRGATMNSRDTREHHEFRSIRHYGDRHHHDSPRDDRSRDDRPRNGAPASHHTPRCIGISSSTTKPDLRPDPQPKDEAKPKKPRKARKTLGPPWELGSKEDTGDSHVARNGKTVGYYEDGKWHGYNHYLSADVLSSDSDSDSDLETVMSYDGDDLVNNAVITTGYTTAF